MKNLWNRFNDYYEITSLLTLDYLVHANVSEADRRLITYAGVALLTTLFLIWVAVCYLVGVGVS